MSDIEIMRAQLLAIRAQVDAALALLPLAAPECPHPIDHREYVPGTMGGAQTFKCGVCGETVHQTAAEVAAEQGA